MNHIDKFKIIRKYPSGEDFNKCLKDAANGDADAMLYLAHYYYDKNEWVQKDMDKSVMWAEKAFSMQNDEAAYFLGNLYLFEGKERIALKWLKKGSLKGSSECSHLLSKIYEHGGEDFRPNGRRRFMYLHRAIAQVGTYIAYRSSWMSELSYFYKNGIGCEPNPLLAYYWFSFRDADFHYRYMIDRFNGNTTLQKSFDSWKSEKCYDSLTLLNKAVEDGSIEAKAILGKICCFMPRLQHLYIRCRINQDPVAEIELKLLPTTYPRGLNHISNHTTKRAIRLAGKRLLEEASQTDESATVTLKRMEDHDDTLYYMISPFQV